MDCLNSFFDTRLTRGYRPESRDLHLILVMSGLWLKHGRRPTLSAAFDVLRRCGVLKSRDVLLDRVAKLVGAGLLRPYQRGRKTNSYAPTVRGIMLLAEHDLEKGQCIAECGVDVQTVRQIGLALLLLYAVKDLVSLDGDLEALVRAIEANAGIDSVLPTSLYKAVSFAPQAVRTFVDARLREVARVVELFERVMLRDAQR